MLHRLAPLVVFVALFACSERSETPYGPCTSSEQCSEATPRCVQFSNVVTMRQIKLCTVGCTTDADCPDHGACAPTQTPGAGSFCMEPCVTTTDCSFSSAICPAVRPGVHGCSP